MKKKQGGEQSCLITAPHLEGCFQPAGCQLRVESKSVALLFKYIAYHISVCVANAMKFLCECLERILKSP